MKYIVLLLLILGGYYYGQSIKAELIDQREQILRCEMENAGYMMLDGDIVCLYD